MISAQADDAAIATGHTQASGRRARRSGKGLLALALGAILLAATACGGPAGARTRSSDGAAAPATSQAVVSIAPKDGATGVDTSGALKVSATKGTLTQVTVTSSDGAAVDGAISADGSSWT